MNFIFQDDFKNQTENNRSSRILPILPICRLATIFAVRVSCIHFSHVYDKSAYYKITTSEA